MFAARNSPRGFIDERLLCGVKIFDGGGNGFLYI